MTETQPNPQTLIPNQPKPNDVLTKQGFLFAKQHSDIFGFFFLGINLATNADKVHQATAKALAGLGSKDDVEHWKRIQENPDRITNKFVSFSKLQCENIVIRMVDNFICFLSETIQSCILAQPEMLLSSATVRVDEVLRHKTHEELITFLVDKKINELTYGGMSEIEGFLSNRTGMTLTDNEEDRRQMIMAIEIRNIYTHNRGTISEIFLKRISKVLPNHTLKKGEKYYPALENLFLMANTLSKLATDLDRLSSVKFSLPTMNYADWEKPSEELPNN